jgi:hypothetical protein
MGLEPLKEKIPTPVSIAVLIQEFGFAVIAPVMIDIRHHAAVSPFDKDLLVPLGVPNVIGGDRIVNG